MRTIATWIALIACLIGVGVLASLLVSPAAASQSVNVSIKPGATPGWAVLRVADSSQALSLTVPVETARQVIATASKGLRVATADDACGPLLRVIAGRGKDALIIGRHRCGAVPRMLVRPARLSSSL